MSSLFSFSTGKQSLSLNSNWAVSPINFFASSTPPDTLHEEIPPEIDTWNTSPISSKGSTNSWTFSWSRNLTFFSSDTGRKFFKVTLYIPCDKSSTELSISTLFAASNTLSNSGTSICSPSSVWLLYAIKKLAGYFLSKLSNKLLRPPLSSFFNLGPESKNLPSKVSNSVTLISSNPFSFKEFFKSSELIPPAIVILILRSLNPGSWTKSFLLTPLPDPTICTEDSDIPKELTLLSNIFLAPSISSLVISRSLFGTAS